MRTFPCLRLFAACLLGSSLLLSVVHADLKLSAPFDGPARFARVSPADFIHLRAELRPDLKARSLEGRVVHRLAPRVDDLRTVTLDAVKMSVLSVASSSTSASSAAHELSHRVFDDRIEIDFDPPLARGEEIEITIDYRATPRRGLYFIESADVYPDRPEQMWTQGEPEDTRHYIPCFDSPSERLTTELLVTVPGEMDVLSNGILVANETNSDGTRTVHWRQDDPHVTYLIAFAAGRYEKLVDTWDSIPITSWHYPGDVERAQVSFGETAKMMAFFSEAFGRYPWPKYDQIVVHEFVAGGMENTSATILTDRTLHALADEPHQSSRGLVAHELAHQWFGDLVTCRDWADLWLNESFATFCEAYYTEHAHGRDEAQMVRLGDAQAYFREAESYRRPISCRTYRTPNAIFDSHTYPKGGLVLELLRDRLGDAAFRRATRSYLEAHAFQSVEAAQFERAIEESAGTSLGQFFHQWIHRGGHPEISVRERYDPERRRLTLDVEQTQKVDEVTPLFHFPVEIGIYFSGSETRIETIEVTKAQETFSFDVPVRPSFVRFDRRSVNLLVKLDHDKPLGAWIDQLARDPDMIGRLRAAEHLGAILAERSDESVRDALLARLELETFWAVRREIVEALSKGSGSAITDALARALNDAEADPRVRSAAARALGEGRHRSEIASAALERAFRNDASEHVRVDALRAYYNDAPNAPLSLAREGLDVASRNDRIRRAAVDIIVDRRDLVSLTRIVEILGSTITDELRTHLIRSAARLARDRPQLVDEAIARHVDDPLVRVRRMVYRTLGDLKTSIARDALSRRRGLEEDDETKRMLDEAIAAASRPTSQDEIARQVDELRRRDEELDRRLRELEEAKRGRP